MYKGLIPKFDCLDCKGQMWRHMWDRLVQSDLSEPTLTDFVDI